MYAAHSILATYFSWLLLGSRLILFFQSNSDPPPPQKKKKSLSQLFQNRILEIPRTELQLVSGFSDGGIDGHS
jgi:hypothetical protein